MDQAHLTRRFVHLHKVSDQADERCKRLDTVVEAYALVTAGRTHDRDNNAHVGGIDQRKDRPYFRVPPF